MSSYQSAREAQKCDALNGFQLMPRHGNQDHKPGSEFDAYATRYNAGMENPVKALLGASADEFVSVKVRWMLRTLPELRAGGRAVRLLDYGCGIATLLRLIAPEIPEASLAGSDISAGMLDEARRAWPDGVTQPELHLQDAMHVPLAAASCDYVVVSAVLHHVPVELRYSVYAEIRRLLRPGGHVIIFEHNPINPITRHVVARTPIDRNAVLLRASEVSQSLHEFEFENVRTQYFMFTPPRFQFLEPLDRLIGWLPMGAQYAVLARR